MSGHIVTYKGRQFHTSLEPGWRRQIFPGDRLGKSVVVMALGQIVNDDGRRGRAGAGRVDGGAAMTFEQACILTDCPAEAWERPAWSRRHRYHPDAVTARARVYAALRCGWRERYAMEMGAPDIAFVCGLRSHSTVITALQRECGSFDPAACRAWLERWERTRREGAAA